MTVWNNGDQRPDRRTAGRVSARWGFETRAVKDVAEWKPRCEGDCVGPFGWEASKRWASATALLESA